MVACWFVVLLPLNRRRAERFSSISAATASYRLLPSIELLSDIPPALHAKFQTCFPPGVIDVSGGRLSVRDPRKDTVSREVLRHPEFEGKVKLGRVRDHFICEFSGVFPASPLWLVVSD